MKVQSEIEYESPIEIWKEKSTKSNKNWQIVKNGEWTKQNTVVCKTDHARSQKENKTKKLCIGFEVEADII